MNLKDRIQHAWNAFTGTRHDYSDHGPSSGRPMHRTVSYNASKFVASIYTRIAVDVSMAKFRHVVVDKKTEDVTLKESGLNECFNVQANIDQTGIAFLHDLVYSMCDEGVVAVVPTDTTISPEITAGYDYDALRVGKIIQWFPKHVRVRLYNEDTGQNEDITLEKSFVAIIENPFYEIMNKDNALLKRLLTKMSQADAEDDKVSSGRMDIVVQVPYSFKTEIQRTNAKRRIEEVEANLAMGRHGIVYMDATEKVTQLNRPINSQLPETVESLTKQLYNQLGLTQSIFDGTATEEQLRFYYSRSIDPILEHIAAEFRRKFLTKTARTQGQDIQYHRDMFKFVTIEMLSSLGDTVRRNSILTSNEVRKILGHKTSNDPRADELFNPNIADKNQNPSPEPPHGSLTPPDKRPNE